jgi:Tol biopolymer transport system component
MVEVSAMKKLAQFVLGLCVLTALAGLASAAPQATGKITFVRSGRGPERIWVMNVNGTRQHAVTPLTMSAETPELSRDGRRIVFSRLIATARTVQHDIYVVNVDGSGLRRLTSATRDETSPTWSPDSGRIAYEANTGKQYDIWVMNANGTGKRRLTRTAQNESVPAWSPGFGRIAYARAFRIWVMNADGSRPHPVSPPHTNGVDWSPAWSPDGTRIAYESNRQTSDHEPTNEVWLMSADGSHQVRLTHNSLNDFQPAWSPDGRWLAFASQIPHPGKNHIWLVRANGKGLHRVTSLADEYHPSWSR